MLQDEMWPRWIISEGKLAKAEKLLASMQKNLEKTKSISPDVAFSIYDKADTGLTSIEDFKRVLRIFFGEVLNESQGDMDFLLRLTK
jgi:Ca2+-binding EF-hand superfamily protein